MYENIRVPPLGIDVPTDANAPSRQSHIYLPAHTHIVGT